MFGSSPVSVDDSKEGAIVPLDLSRLNVVEEDELIDPRKLYSTLENRRWKRLRPEQAEVLDSWYERRDERDLVVKQNTGAGKTLTGLLIALSSMREGVGPVVYLVPNNYLIDQVMKEAIDACIPVTNDEDDIKFRAQQSVLVTTYHKLINGRSVFGVMDVKPPKVTVGTIVLDDAHVSIGIVKSQYSLNVPRGAALYSKILKLFENDLKVQSRKRYEEIASGESGSCIPVPFQAVQREEDSLIKMLVEASRDVDERADWYFSWDLVADLIPYCSITVTARDIEIRPPCPDMAKLSGFANAKRRVYLTATMEDVDVLVSELGADEKTVGNPIMPKQPFDLGDRMILAPRAINPNIDDSAVRQMVRDFADGVAHSDIAKVNVVVLVPSDYVADCWSECANYVLHVDDMEPYINRLKSGEHLGVVVLVNKYDGIDLPDDACRILVIDGVPTALTPYEMRQSAALYGCDSFKMRTLQRVEQGMGRGTRDIEDYCAVLLLGTELATSLVDRQQQQYYSSATRAQIRASGHAAEVIADRDISAIAELLGSFLLRDENWTQFSRRNLAQVQYSSRSTVSELASARRKAFDLVRGHSDISKGIRVLSDAIRSLGNERLKEQGWFLEELACYQNLIDPSAAQRTLRKACQMNPAVIKPSVQLDRSPKVARLVAQADAVLQYFASYSDKTLLQLDVQSIFSGIHWGESGNSDAAEECFKRAGQLLGFDSTRPEKEDNRGGGPDNLWRLSTNEFLVVELKTEVSREDKRIIKTEAAQLAHAVSWLSDWYGDDVVAIPIFVHPSSVTRDDCHPLPGTRVITKECWAKLGAEIRSLVTELVSRTSAYTVEELADALMRRQLDHKQFIDRFTVQVKRSLN